MTWTPAPTAPLVLAPDALELVIGWLFTQSELNALVSGRVSSKLPTNKTYPLVRVSRIGGGEVEGVYHWLHDPLLQVDCYASRGDETQSFSVARVASALLSQRFHGVVTVGTTSAVVSKVVLGGIHQGYDKGGSGSTARDGDIPVARFDAQVTLHPSV